MSLGRRLRSYIYDTTIVPMTTGWYRAVLDRLPRDCRLLDVGIGTGAALVGNASLLREKNVHVVGVDIDAAYIDRCREAVRAAALADRVEPQLQSIYDHQAGPYDAVYFSASFMLLPDPVAGLRHVCSLLRPGGRVYFTQTFEHERSWLVDVVKPLLRLVTTIDFGRVTYEEDFKRTLATAGVEIEERVALHGGARRSAILVVARP